MTIHRKSGTSSATPIARRGARRTENALQDDVRLAYEESRLVRLFRNNVGAFKDAYGKYVVYGLCPGSSDLIGWRTITHYCDVCSPHGLRIAQFAALEIKDPKNKRRQDNQTSFLQAVRDAGGIAGYADSVEAALNLLPPK